MVDVPDELAPPEYQGKDVEIPKTEVYYCDECDRKWLSISHYNVDPDPSTFCSHCGKDYEDFSDLGCEHCDRRHPLYGLVE